MWDSVRSFRRDRPLEPLIAELVRSEPVGDDDERRWVDRLVETLLGCYAAGRLPSEAGVSWAGKGSKIDLKDYRGFTG